MDYVTSHRGYSEEARNVAANDFKYWELMRKACERGYRIYDFGRSKRDTGPFDFKTNWGFEPTPLHYEYFLVNTTSIPENNPTNPKYRWLTEELRVSLWAQDLKTVESVSVKRLLRAYPVVTHNR